MKWIISEEREGGDKDSYKREKEFQKQTIKGLSRIDEKVISSKVSNKILLGKLSEMNVSLNDNDFKQLYNDLLAYFGPTGGTIELLDEEVLEAAWKDPYCKKQIEKFIKAWLGPRVHYISELRDGMSDVSIEGKIVNLSEPKEVETRYGKTSLVKAKLKDRTGCVVLNLFGDQIDMVALGDVVRIERGYTSVYEGELALNVPLKKGK